MINRVGFTPGLSNRIGFKESLPQQIANEFKGIELDNLDAIADFDLRHQDQPTKTLINAAALLAKSHPHHARYLGEMAEQEQAKK